MLTMSLVRYLMSGMACFVSVVMTSSPGWPGSDFLVGLGVDYLRIKHVAVYVQPLFMGTFLRDARGR